MAEKYRGGRVAPAEASGPPRRRGGGGAAGLPRRDGRASRSKAGAAAAFRIVDAANEYIAETEPWALARDEKNAARLSQVLFDVAEALRVAGILLLPIIPKSAAEILRRVGETTTRATDPPRARPPGATTASARFTKATPCGPASRGRL